MKNYLILTDCTYEEYDTLEDIRDGWFFDKGTQDNCIKLLYRPTKQGLVCDYYNWLDDINNELELKEFLNDKLDYYKGEI